MPRESQPSDDRGTEPQPSVESVVDARSASVETDTGNSSAASPSPELQAALDEAQANFARYQRMAADFENYKRRTRQELADRTQYANEELLRKVLPILDNFRRILAHVPEGVDRNWLEGIRMVARQFEATLESQGLSTIPSLGERFDPSQHEAIGREETDEQEEGTIVEEVQPGYRLHDRVLRPTLVKVAQPPALKT